MLRPGANLPGNLPDVVDAGQQMFVKALTLEFDWRPLMPVVVGIVVAAAVAGFLAWRQASTSSDAPPAQERQAE